MNAGISELALVRPARSAGRAQLRSWGAPTQGAWRSVHLAAPDEDALTFAVDAVRRLDTAGIDSLGLASLSLPYRQRVQAGLIAESIGASRLFVSEHSGSARAGTEALSAHLWRLQATGRPAVVVAAESGPRRLSEFGDASAGAVALRIESGGSIAEFLGACSAVAEAPGIGFVPQSGQKIMDIGVPAYSRHAFQSLLGTVLEQVHEQTGLQAAEFASVVVTGIDAKTASRSCAALGRREARLREESPLGPGPADTVAPLAGLVTALQAARSGDPLLLLVYGAGSALDAVVLRAGADVGRAGEAASGAVPRELTQAELFEFTGVV